MKAGNLQLRRTFRRVELKTFWLGAVLALVSMVAPSTMFAQTIRTIAGTGTGGYTGDNGAATTANIAAPYGLATDNAGNIYLPTSGFSIVRKVDISGVITTIAGTGVSGYSGDGGAATNAQFNQPIAAAVDNSGNIYIGDEGGHVVRKIDNSGIITTVAGDGTLGSTGDGGAATNAQLSQVLDVSVDNAGNIYIADQTNKVRMVNTSGIISTFAGTGGSGYTGDNGSATAATLNYETRVSPDNMGNVYIVDAGNNVVRKVDNLGNITTFAGTGGIGYTGDGGPATAATFSGGIGGVEINRFTGEVYISDANNNVIRKVNSSGNISTIAGNGTAGYSGDGGAATSAQLNSPHNIDFDLNGNLIVGDYANYVVRLVTANNPPSFDNGTVQSLTVCSNTAPTDINSMLAASDADAGQTETWSLSSAPANGTVAVDYSATSAGGSITPTGLTYQPNTGFSGTDAFTVMIDDGNGGTATTTINVTVNPTPDVTVTNGDQSVCNNNATLAITFTGSVGGTSYDWMNSDPSIGIGASGNGDILSFNATNSDPALPVVAVLTVTPSYLGCVGTPQTFTITVNPTPSVSPMSNQAYCNGETAGPFNFSGPVAGTTFTWTNSDNTIGLASLGAGDIGTFTATNATTDPVSAVIQVNSSANGCTGTSNSFTIVVNPTPMLSSSATPPDVCDGTMFSYTPTTSATGGTPFFDWSRATVAGISNAAATGSDDPAEVLVNTTPNPVAVTYVYTLSVNSCTNVQSVTVNVNPTPMLSGTLTPPAICDSTAFVYKDTSLTAGTTTRGIAR